MHFEAYSFGSIRIDGKTYEHDVVIDRATSASAKRNCPKSSATPLDTLRFQSGRTYPGSADGLDRYRHWSLAGHGRGKAKRTPQNQMAILSTTEAIKALQENPDETNAILHITC